VIFATGWSDTVFLLLASPPYFNQLIRCQALIFLVKLIVKKPMKLLLLG